MAYHGSACCTGVYNGSGQTGKINRIEEDFGSCRKRKSSVNKLNGGNCMECIINEEKHRKTD